MAFYLYINLKELKMNFFWCYVTIMKTLESTIRWLNLLSAWLNFVIQWFFNDPWKVKTCVLSIKSFNTKVQLAFHLWRASWKEISTFQGNLFNTCARWSFIKRLRASNSTNYKLWRGKHHLLCYESLFYICWLFFTANLKSPIITVRTLLIFWPYFCQCQVLCLVWVVTNYIAVIFSKPKQAFWSFFRYPRAEEYGIGVGGKQLNM